MRDAVEELVVDDALQSLLGQPAHELFLHLRDERSVTIGGYEDETGVAMSGYEVVWRRGSGEEDGEEDGEATQKAFQRNGLTADTQKTTSDKNRQQLIGTDRQQTGSRQQLTRTLPLTFISFCFSLRTIGNRITSEKPERSHANSLE